MPTSLRAPVRITFLLPLLLQLPLAWMVPASALDYAPCPDAGTAPGLAGTLCARARVPADHDDPDAAERVDLFVRRFPAAGPSRGQVWAVAGGPGESGASLYPFVATLRRSFPGYDLLIPDHRGTGLSTRLCPTEEAPASPGGTALDGAEWASCFSRLAARPDIARRFTITQAARDLAWLLRQDGNGQPAYLYGVSYGTQLALRTLQLERLPLRGVVLDSLVPLETDAQRDLSRRSQVVDEVGRRVLAGCDADPACAARLGAPAERVLRRVLARPALPAGVPGNDLRQFLGMLLDMPALRARLPALLADLDRGGSTELDAILAALPTVRAELGDYPQTPPSIPLVSIISASENDLRPGRGVSRVREEESALLLRSPLPALLAASTLPRYPRDAWFGGHPAAMPPTLVLHGTLDPKTPYGGALEHLAALDGRGPAALVTVDGAPHFILWTAPGCFARHVRAFVEGATPAGGRCLPEPHDQ